MRIKPDTYRIITATNLDDLQIDVNEFLAKNSPQGVIVGVVKEIKGGMEWMQVVGVVRG